MHKESLLAYLNAKPELTQMVLRAGSDPDFLNTLFFIVRTERSTVRYSCTKTIHILSEQQPQTVYPYFDEIAAWLHNTNSFIKWDGILTLANLVAVDKENRFDLLYEEYLALIRDPQMITAANVAGNAWKLVQARPEWEPDITKRLLEVPDIVYLHHGEPSPECTRVLCGHVLNCFDHYFDESKRQAEILQFAQNLLDCPRKAVAKSAARFLRQHST